MPKKKKHLDQFIDLTWNDLEEWAGYRIVGRGRNYQRQDRVSDLATTDDGALMAWVDGSERYATRVEMGKDGLPESICTCPYAIDCKHGVAVVIEYLELTENNRRIRKAKKDDERLELLKVEDRGNELDDEDRFLSEKDEKINGTFLKGRTKAQLIELILEMAQQHPEISEDLADRRHLNSGNIKALVTRLRREIRDIGGEPGWQNYWQGEGYTPDYSGIRNKLTTLLQAGHADEVLAIGEELISTGTRQVEESHDDGETAMEIESCMPVIVKALKHSSLEPADKLAWSVDAVLKDQFEICEDIDEACDLYGGKVKSLFFPAGNTIAMPTPELAAICRYGMEKFSGLQRITVYGSSRYIAKKGMADLATLREAGLGRIHVGLESGDDDILRRVKKGTNASEQVKAGKLVKEAGMELSEYVILGLGGVGSSQSHALKTAATITEIEPNFVRLRTLVPKINTLLLHEIKKGRFQLLSAHQVLKETRLLLENLQCRTILSSDHYTNYLNLSGKLPKDKDRLLGEIDRALNRDPGSFRPFFIGNQ